MQEHYNILAHFGYTQWMCVLPQDNNQGAGQLWKNKCGKVKTEAKTEGSPINNKVFTQIVSTDQITTAFSL